MARRNAGASEVTDMGEDTKSELSVIYPELPDTPEAAIWPCYIGDHDACVGKSSDGTCPCLCHVRSVLTNHGDTNCFDGFHG
jgi:hypothetical protein